MLIFKYKDIDNFFNKISKLNPNDAYDAETILSLWREFNPPFNLDKPGWNFFLNLVKRIINCIVIKERKTIMKDKRFLRVKLAMDFLYR